MRPASIASRIRGFLEHKPEQNYAEVARAVGTTEAYVQKIASEARRRGENLPRRWGNNRAARQERTPPEEVCSPSDFLLHGSTLRPAVPAPDGAGSGLEVVRVRLTRPPAPEPSVEGWVCDCGHEGEGKPPAVCPKCGEPSGGVEE